MYGQLKYIYFTDKSRFDLFIFLHIVCLFISQTYMRAFDFLKKYVFWLRSKRTDVTLAVWKNSLIWAIEEWLCQIHALTKNEGWKVKTEVTFNDMRETIYDFKTAYPIESVIWIWWWDKQVIKNFLTEEFQLQDFEDWYTYCDVYCPGSIVTQRHNYVEVSPWKKLMPGEYKISWGCWRWGKFWSYVEFNPACENKCKPCDCWWFIEYYASYKQITSLDDIIDLPYQYFPVLSYFVWASIVPWLESYAAWTDVNWITIWRDLINEMKSKKVPSKVVK